MKARYSLPISLCLVIALCGFTESKTLAYKYQKDITQFGQPKDERNAQDKLPQAHDAAWQTLGATKIKLDENKGLFSATYPDAVKALTGKQMTISGFMLPLEASEKFKHFILSKRTPTCFFCPPGTPTEVVDVWLDKAVPWDENLVKVTGTFTLMNDQQLGMFFKLTDAKIENFK